MSKRIKQSVEENGNVFTSTAGTPRGNLKNFDASIFTPSLASKKGSELTIKIEGKREITLDGRQINTLRNVFDRHFDTVE